MKLKHVSFPFQWPFSKSQCLFSVNLKGTFDTCWYFNAKLVVSFLGFYLNRSNYAITPPSKSCLLEMLLVIAYSETSSGLDALKFLRGSQEVIPSFHST